MNRPIIKFCGFKDPEDARAAVLAGADLLGLNFHPESVRAIDFKVAKRIKEAAVRTFNPKRRGFKPGIVALFVNAPSELIEGVIREIQPDLLQFHGDESVEECTRYDHAFIKGIRLGGHQDLSSIPDYVTPKSRVFLVDAFSSTHYGGTGQLVSGELAQRALTLGKGLLAGGLTPDNVADIVHTLRPYGVDVASGIESRPGKKSARLMHAFVRSVEEGIGRPR
jgi:phosphoribosylanthranilate isomerase